MTITILDLNQKRIKNLSRMNALFFVSYAHIYVHIWHMTFAAFLKSCCKVVRGRISVRTSPHRGRPFECLAAPMF